MPDKRQARLFAGLGSLEFFKKIFGDRGKSFLVHANG